MTEVLILLNKSEVTVNVAQLRHCTRTEDLSSTEEDTDSDSENKLVIRQGNYMYVGYEDDFLNSLPRKNITRKRERGGKFKKDETMSLYTYLQKKWPSNGLICSCMCVFVSAAGVQSHIKRLNKNKKCRLYTVRYIYELSCE